MHITTTAPWIAKLPQDLNDQILSYFKPKEALDYFLICKITNQFSKRFLVHNFKRFSIQQQEEACSYHIPKILYQNKWKNRDVDREVPRNFSLEKKIIAKGQESREEKNFGENPTQATADSSTCFNMIPIDAKIIDQESMLLLQLFINSFQEGPFFSKTFLEVVRQNNSSLAELLINTKRPILRFYVTIAFASAVDEQNLSIVEAILDSNLEIDSYSLAFNLITAVQQNNEKIAKEILNSQRKLSFHENRMIKHLIRPYSYDDAERTLYFAIKNHKNEIAQEILDSDIALSYDILSKTLYMAIEDHNDTIVPYLLNSTRDIASISLGCILRLAIEKKSETIALQILDSNREIDSGELQLAFNSSQKKESKLG